MPCPDLVGDELGAAMLRIALPARPGEKIKALLRRTAQRTGLTYGQVKRLHYREWPALAAHVALADRIRALDLKAREAEARAELARREHDAVERALSLAGGDLTTNRRGSDPGLALVEPNSGALAPTLLGEVRNVKT